MTTEEAKKYCIEVMGMSESDFTKASDEDVDMELAKDGEWVHHYKIGYPVDEYEMETAINIATDHKFWSNQENVDNYIDFMMSN